METLTIWLNDAIQTQFLTTWWWVATQCSG